MRVIDISKQSKRKHRLYNVVARHTNSILNSTQTDLATVAPPLLLIFWLLVFFNSAITKRGGGGGVMGLEYGSAIQILTGIY